MSKRKEELIEEQKETVEEDGKAEKQVYQSWVDKDFFKLNSTIGEEEVEPISVGRDHIKKLQERFKKQQKKVLQKEMTYLIRFTIYIRNNLN